MYKETTHAKLANVLLEMNFNLSENSTNLFVYLLQRAYSEEVEDKSGAPCVTVARSRLIDVAGIAKNGGRLRFYLEELQTTIFRGETDEMTISAPMISTVVWRIDLDAVTIEFSRLFWPILSNFVQNYTTFDITHLWLINGRYVKRFFMDVMRWANTGAMKLNIDNLRARYETDYSYNDIQRRIIEPGIRQIHEYTNLKIVQGTHTKRGKKVETLNFSIHKPNREALEPMGEKLVRMYGVNETVARLVINTLPFKDILAVLETVDKNRRKVNNVGAYTAQIFRSYGIKDNATKKPNIGTGQNKPA